MNWNDLYDKALQIAIKAHKGQKDKSGREYIMHPIRVAERCKDPRAKIVALLHDVIEDTDVTADYLRSHGFPEEIIEGVKNGKLAIADVDRNVRRMLEYIVKTPSFHEFPATNKPDLKAHAQITRQSATEGIVLLSMTSVRTSI